MIKVMYVSSRNPFPIRGGREFMIAQSLKFLSSFSKVEFVYFEGKSDSGIFENNTDIKFNNIHKINFAHIPRFIANVFFRRRSLQENLYYSRKAHNQLNTIVQNFKPDVIVCDMIRTAQFFNESYPLVVDLDDLLSRRYELMLSETNKNSFLGTYTDRVPRMFAFLEGFVRNAVLKYEANAVRQAEIEVYKKSKSVIMTSPIEADHLNNLLNSNKAVGIYQAAECNPNNLASTNKLIFIGNLKTAQNLASLEYIVEELLPKLDELGVDYILDVFGGYDERATKIVDNANRANLFGFIEDLSTAFEGARVAVCHVAFGTGIKTKLLDSLSYGLPTIANTTAIEGLKVSHGHNLMVSDAPKEQALIIKRLLEDDAFAKNLSLGAVDYIQKEHDSDMLRDRFKAAIYSAL